MIRFDSVSASSDDFNHNKRGEKKHHTVGTAPKSNQKIVERDKIDTLNTHLYDRSLSWLDTEASMQSDGVKLGLLLIVITKPSL